MTQHGDHIGRPRVLLRPWLLLLLAEAPSDGYELIERLGSVGFDWDGRPGPIYRELRTMERDALARATSSTPATGPVRHVYHLTDGGWDYLRQLGRFVGHLEEHTRTYPDRHVAVLL